jgi:hypothetical protein
MRWRSFIALSVFISLGILLARMTTGSGNGSDKAGGWTEDIREAEAPFALVELFTSEGCSSCPPADALLGEIVQDARKQGRRVFGLAFHVDYWNQLGWTDPYSTPAHSRRQRSYARAFKNYQVYTPQMIVNGTEDFVGSDRRRSRAAIEAALKRPGRAQVKLQQDEASAHGSLAISYVVAGVARGTVLNVAVVERNVMSTVKRGENGGRTLRHENVVRAFQTLRLDNSGKGTVHLALPADLVYSKASAIGYVQEADTGAVLGATSMTLARDTTRGERQ